MRYLRRFVTVILFLIFLCCMTSSESNGQSVYQLPPKEVVDIIDSKPDPGIALSPDTRWMLMIDRDSMPDIADLSRRMLSLAGMRIDPIANSPFQTDFNRGLSLRARDGGESIRIPIQAPVRLSGVSWSHDSSSFVYSVVTDHGTELWWASIEQPTKPVRMTDRLNAVLESYDWMPDGKRVLCTLIPEGRGAEPSSSAAPFGPNIQESYGNTSPTRTYQDLLSNAQDERLFEHYATSQLAILELGKAPWLIGKPAIWDGVVSSPDGKHLLATKIVRPFSYLLTLNSFPKEIDVLSLGGQVLYRVAAVPLEENIPIEGVRLGRRSVQWRPGFPATLVWVEALDEGDPRKKVPFRDQIKTLDAPFQEPVRDLVRVEHRFAGLTYFSDPKLVMTTEMDR
ncbi:MAG: hypothetical protein ABL921_32875, partial [Pirellula sp.]